MTDRVLDLTPRRVGRTWVFPDGTVLPVVAGGDETAEPAVPAIQTEVPEDLADREAVTDEALAELEAALIAEVDSLLDAGSADLELFAALADEVERVRSEAAARIEADTENEQAIAEQLARIRPAAEADPDDPPEGEDEGDGAVEGEGDEPEAVEADAPAAQPEPVAASAATRRTPRPPRASAMRRHAAPPQVPARPAEGAQDGNVLVSITAAADVPGYAQSAQMSVLDIANGFHARARGLPDHSDRKTVATLTRTYPESLTQTQDPSQDFDLVARATEVESAAALVAAGGWCTPHQNLYDIFAIEGTDALYDTPTIGITRGGINVPDFFGYNAADGALWSWTAANDETVTSALANMALTSNVLTVDTAAAHGLAVGDSVTINTSTAAFADLNGQTVTVASVTDADTFTAAFTHANIASGAAVGSIGVSKPCFRIPCPTWTDYELGTDGVCLTHGNLTDRAYPELTARYVNLAMAAHERRIASLKLVLLQSATHSDDVTHADGASDAYGEILDAIDLQASDYRSQYGMSSTAVLEQVWPMWAPNVIRAALGRRAGVDMRRISLADVVGEFTDRNVRPQFVRDYQELWDGSAATAWPATIKFIQYPAGGFITGDGGELNLGVVRDSTLNATNDFTAAWSEQSWLFARRGPKAREVTVTTRVDGVTACCA